MLKKIVSNFSADVHQRTVGFRCVSSSLLRLSRWKWQWNQAPLSASASFQYTALLLTLHRKWEIRMHRFNFVLFLTHFHPYFYFLTLFTTLCMTFLFLKMPFLLLYWNPPLSKDLLFPWKLFLTFGVNRSMSATRPHNIALAMYLTLVTLLVLFLSFQLQGKFLQSEILLCYFIHPTSINRTLHKMDS